MESTYILKKIKLLRSPPDLVCFVKCFSYKDIKKATDGFRRTIDNSGNGAAYRAKFPNGHVSVVKEFKVSEDYDDDAFYEEVQLLGRLHHRHIVALYGFSVGQKRFLVFENMEKGSLKEHLSDPLKTPLNWRTRLQIAIGIAAALEYLHFFCDPPIYNVTINSNTILLDENFTPKLSEISLLRPTANHDTMPNSLCSGECTSQTCKNMVFQLGLLILELITGQCSGNGGVDLIQWVQQPGFRRSIHKMIDPDLGNDYDSRELRGLLAVARLCIMPVDRPRVYTPQILRYLQKKIGIA